MPSVNINCENYCRTCGYCDKNDVKFTNLFEMEKLKNALKFLKDWNLNIEENDGLPQGVCTDCENMLDSICNFQKKTIAANENLILLFQGGSEAELITQKNQTNQIKLEYIGIDDDIEKSFVQRPNFETITVESKELLEMYSEEAKIDCDPQAASPKQYNTRRKRKTVMDNKDYDSDNFTLSFLCEAEKKKKHVNSKKEAAKNKISKSKCVMQDKEFVQEISEIGTVIHGKKGDLENTALNEPQLGEINELIEMQNKTIKTDPNTGKRCRLCFGNPAELPVFANKEELENHLSEEHDDKERPFNCIHCTVKYQSRSGIRKHVNTVHLQNQTSMQNRSSEMDIKKGVRCRYCIGNPSERPTFANAVEFEKHFTKKHYDKERPYNCVHCSVKYQSRSGVQKHFNTVHLQTIVPATDIKKDEHCRYCIGNSTERLIFANEAEFEEHFAKEHYDKERPYNCLNCSMKYQSRSGVRKHVATVHLEKHLPNNSEDEATESNEKEKKAESENLTLRLLREIKGLAAKQKPAPRRRLQNIPCEKDTKKGERCRYCIGNHSDRPAFSNEAEFEEHFAKEHYDKERPYNCVHCSVKYQSRSGVRKHVNNVHLLNHERCDICNKIIPGGTGHLRNHILSNHTQGDYTCDICGLVLKNSSLNNFNYHKRWHNEDKLLKCDHCERRFVRPTHLREHLVTHTKQCEYLCAHCGQRTRTAWELRCHLYSEHGEGDAPIKCHICGENFTKRAQKIVHMKKYHSEIQVLCEICNKPFSSDSNLHRHLKGQHGVNDIQEYLQSSEKTPELIIS